MKITLNCGHDHGLRLTLSDTDQDSGIAYDIRHPHRKASFYRHHKPPDEAKNGMTNSGPVILLDNDGVALGAERTINVIKSTFIRDGDLDEGLLQRAAQRFSF